MKIWTFSIKLTDDLFKFANRRAREIQKERREARVNRNRLFRDLLIAEKTRLENGKVK